MKEPCTKPRAINILLVAIIDIVLALFEEIQQNNLHNCRLHAASICRHRINRLLPELQFRNTIKDYSPRGLLRC